jgi:peptidoglycan hydrolase-like amidase
MVTVASSKQEDISFSPGREPVVRIGVVLARDGKSRVDAETLQDGYAIAVSPDEASQAAIGSGPISIQASDGRLRVVAKAFARSGFRSLRMVPPVVGASRCPNAAVLVRGVVAGRGFHWCTKIDQRLGGVLEFRADNSNLILINELPLEEYLTGVITAEMSGYCPGEYMKAHAVISRSWLLASSRSNHPGEPFTWCNDDCCQRYQGNSGWTRPAIDALAATRGQVLVTATGKICRTSFCKNSGGITEDPQSAWRAASPGLRARFDGPADAPEARFFPLDAADMRDYICGKWLATTRLYASPAVVSPDQLTRFLNRLDCGVSSFRWRVDLGQEGLRNSIAEASAISDLDVVQNIEPGRRGKSGRLEEIVVTYRSKSGGLSRKRIGPEYRIRKALHSSFLYSSAIVIDATKDYRGTIKTATFRGAGWGHGVGLCQTGGLGRAMVGQGYEQILSAYYDQVTLRQVYD